MDIVLFAEHLLNILVEAKVQYMSFQQRRPLCISVVSLALGASAEVSVGEDERSHEGPGVEEEADPAGTDLDPHSWPLAGHALEVCIRAEKTAES